MRSEAEQAGLIRRRDPKPISHTGFRRDMAGMRAIGIQLLAERADCDPQHLERGVIALLSPDFSSQPALCQESAGIKNEDFQ